MDEISMFYSLNPGSSWGLIKGTCENQNASWILIADTLAIRIDHNDILVGFRKSSVPIEMKKKQKDKGSQKL
ncbi:hypothetical protein [Croceimicrobium hydrocarbonivorans]|uniref:Uncharacterized protein n=1 Tax=Croceimicrobium hydrocarbonivorans TaxID=2761580 RepID=A0A7H0VFP8_9FLAO|nr:hypothetical protein [Croceimicrobium hydrocarbonivorans]QNR24546.1 hypothetical protein H4K34_01515 [Croceimicrobium hydrocarbonivorans]